MSITSTSSPLGAASDTEDDSLRNDSAADTPPVTDPTTVFDLTDHLTVQDVLDRVADALRHHDKAAALAHLLVVNHALGRGWHPARRPVRGIESAIDISRWDIAEQWVAEAREWFDPHPSPEVHNS